MRQPSNIAFGNLITACRTQSPTAFSYWRDEYFKSPTGDAMEYAVRVLDGVRAEGVIHFASMTALPFATKSKMVPEELKRNTLAAMESIEALLSYDLLPTLPAFIQCSPNQSVPDDPLDRVLQIFDYMNRGIDTDDEMYELQNIASSQAEAAGFRNTFLRFAFADVHAGVVELPPLDFFVLAQSLAGIVSIQVHSFAVIDKAKVLAGRCAKRPRATTPGSGRSLPSLSPGGYQCQATSPTQRTTSPFV